MTLTFEWLWNFNAIVTPILNILMFALAWPTIEGMLLSLGWIKGHGQVQVAIYLYREGELEILTGGSIENFVFQRIRRWSLNRQVKKAAQGPFNFDVISLNFSIGQGVRKTLQSTTQRKLNENYGLGQEPYKIHWEVLEVDGVNILAGVLFHGGYSEKILSTTDKADITNLSLAERAVLFANQSMKDFEPSELKCSKFTI